MISSSNMYIFYRPPVGRMRFGAEAELGNGFVRQACLRPSVCGGGILSVSMAS